MIDERTRNQLLINKSEITGTYIQLPLFRICGLMETTIQQNRMEAADGGYGMCSMHHARTLSKEGNMLNMDQWRPYYFGTNGECYCPCPYQFAYVLTKINFIITES
jgi:hypothetical protein